MSQHNYSVASVKPVKKVFFVLCINKHLAYYHRIYTTEHKGSVKLKYHSFTEHTTLYLKFLLITFGGRKAVEEQLIKVFSKCPLLPNVGSSILGKVDF